MLAVAISNLHPQFIMLAPTGLPQDHCRSQPELSVIAVRVGQSALYARADERSANQEDRCARDNRRKDFLEDLGRAERQRDLKQARRGGCAQDLAVSFIPGVAICMPN